jgi:peroxiredoxin
MGNQRCPLQPGEASPAFTLPAANREGMVSLADLRGRPFLVGFYRGLHCPFCRRQVVQLGAAQPALLAAGIETLTSVCPACAAACRRAAVFTASPVTA